MKKTVTVIVVVFVILLLFLLTGPFYVVEEGQQAVVVRFGRIIDVHQEAGLKIKVPFVDSVERYSKKVLAWDGEAQLIPTQENQFIWVDTTARWRIVDPKLFYQSVGTMTQAALPPGRRDRLHGAQGHLPQPAGRGRAQLQRDQPDRARRTCT